MVAGVYKLINVHNNKFYIGSSNNLEKRKNEHLNDLRNNRHHNIKLQRAFNKYGEGSFLFEIIEEIAESDFNILKNMLLDREQYYLDMYKNNFRELFNICIKAESCLGVKRNENTKNKIKYAAEHRSVETRRKISESKKGRGYPHSEETKRKISESNKGKIFTEEHRDKISKSRAGKSNTKGFKHSEETKRKISLIKSNIPDETRKKMSDSAKIKIFTEEHRRKIGESHRNIRKVINLDTGEIYKSITEASTACNLNHSGIRNTCAGINKKCGGYRWSYYNKKDMEV